jgi:hypothetical protein
VQAGAAVATDVVGTLGTQPLLLVLVLLNMVFAGVAGVFLLKLEEYRANSALALIELMRACILDTNPRQPL